MHELSATQGMLDVALEAAMQAGAGRIRSIEVVIGDLSSFVDDSVQFYFDLISRGTAADGAVLRFRRAPAHGRCGTCGSAFPVTPPLPRSCSACGSLALRVVGGREFRVESIEVDE